MPDQTVRTRMAPSPTGEDIHIGNLYTGLINWAFAKKNNGKFIIRIEDTDRERLVPGSEEKILDSFKKFGLNYDEGPDNGGPFGPYRQSERLDLYQKYAKELVDKDEAYYCFCTKEKLEEIKKIEEKVEVKKKHREFCDLLDNEERIKNGESFVIRLKSPTEGDVKFNDLIRGEIVINSSQVDDQVLLKSDGYPTYHLGVVVDDHLMEITHIIRAEEWISSTPKHVLLYRAFGWQMPVLAHVPLLRNPDKSKLSKRKNPVWVSFYLEEGYLPEALLNFLALMGWSHPEQKEIFSLEEYIEKLDIKKFSPVGPVFDIAKLDWMNGEYIRKMPDEELVKRLHDFLIDHPSKERLTELVPLVKERIKKLSDFIPLTAWIFEDIEYDKQFFERTKVDNPSDVLNKVLEKLEGMEKPWDKEVFESTFVDLAKEQNLNNTQMFQLIRVAVSGQLISPPLFESLQILGEEKTIERINSALKFLEK